MLLRRTYTANVRPMMTMMKRPPITPAAIRGVLAIRIRDFTCTARLRDQRVLGYIKHSHVESSITTLWPEFQPKREVRANTLTHGRTLLVFNHYTNSIFVYKPPCICEESCGQGNTTCTLMANANLQWQNEDTGICSSLQELCLNWLWLYPHQLMGSCFQGKTSQWKIPKLPTQRAFLSMEEVRGNFTWKI